MIEVTELLCLRPLTLAEAKAISDGKRSLVWASDYPQVQDVEIASYLLRQVDSRWPSQSQFQIVDRGLKQVIGGIGYWKRTRSREMEIGYAVVPSRRNTGVATDVLIAMATKLRIDFSKLGLYLKVEQKNEASLATAAKAGFSEVSLDLDMCTLILRQPKIKSKDHPIASSSSD